MWFIKGKLFLYLIKKIWGELLTFCIRFKHVVILNTNALARLIFITLDGQQPFRVINNRPRQPGRFFNSCQVPA